jgi:hypothetical protein
MNAFFDELTALFVEAAKQRGVTIEPPVLDPKMAELLLNFSAVVAHTRERRFAPLSTYVAGLAAARLQAANASADLIGFIEAVKAKLEPAAT